MSEGRCDDGDWPWIALAFGCGWGLTLAALLLRACWERHHRKQQTFDVFLSYRHSSDSLLVDRLYHLLEARDLRVWYDKKSLSFGQRWEDGFVAGLRSSLVVVPVLSRQALAPFAELVKDSACDNVLLEQALALELKERSVVLALTPLLVGAAPEKPGGPSRQGSNKHNRAAGAEDGKASVVKVASTLERVPSDEIAEPSDAVRPAMLEVSHSSPELLESRARSGGQLVPEQLAAHLKRRGLRRQTSGGGSSRSTLAGFITRPHLPSVDFDRDFFQAGGVPECGMAEVTAVWHKVATHLRSIAAGFTPLIRQRGVPAC